MYKDIADLFLYSKKAKPLLFGQRLYWVTIPETTSTNRTPQALFPIVRCQ